MSGSVFTEKMSWYVIHTKPRQEFRALEQLRNQHYTCFLPTLSREKVRRGKLETCVEPLFAQYLFIRLNSVADNWMPIRSTRGVHQLLSFGGRLATLPDTCVEALRNTSRALHQRAFERGDRVTILQGPFAGLEGIYQLPDGDARALVLVQLMSQPQRLKFALEMLRRAA